MRILLNGFELPKQADGLTPVGQVLLEIKDEITRSGRVVSGISIDGAPLPQGWQRRKRLSLPVSMFKSMDIEIANPNDLKVDTIQHTKQMCQALVAASQPLAMRFRLGDEVSANLQLANYLENLKLVLAGLDHTSRGAPETVTGGNLRGQIETAASQFMPTLDRIYKAQAAGDYVSIADELEYELQAHLDTWSGLADRLLASCKTVSEPVNA